MLGAEPTTGAGCGLLQSEPVFISSACLGELSWSLYRDEHPLHLPGFPMGLQQTSFSRKTVLYLNMILSRTGTQHRTRGSERGFDSSSLSRMYKSLQCILGRMKCLFRNLHLANDFRTN